MNAPTLGRHARRFPVGLLGMLVLVAASEWALRARSLDFVAVWSDDWRRAAEVASTGLPGRDVLFLGDSMVKYGVLPKVIEARTGLKSYNLAVNAGTMPTTYFLLRRALDSGARPKAVVADFYALMKFEDPSWRALAYSDLATVRDCFDLAWTARDPDLASRTLLGKVLTSYKARYEIRTGVLGAFKGQRTSAWPAQEVTWKTWELQDGAQPMAFMPWGFAYDPALHSSLLLDRWECDAFHAAYIEKFLALAESRQIPVFWLMPPLSPRVHASRRPLGTDEAYSRLARAAMARHPNVEVLDARDSGYDDSAHVDVIHLEQRGAKVLSADLGEILADRIRGHRPPSPDRWVALPAFSGRSGDEPVRGLARSVEPSVR